jgi:hypothetical protein
VYNTHRINGFSDFVHRPDSKELEDKNTTFRKLDLFPSSGKGDMHTLLGPLERANLNHLGHVVFLSSNYLKSGRWTKSENPLIVF